MTIARTTTYTISRNQIGHNHSLFSKLKSGDRQSSGLDDLQELLAEEQAATDPALSQRHSGCPRSIDGVLTMPLGMLGLWL